MYTQCDQNIPGGSRVTNIFTTCQRTAGRTGSSNNNYNADQGCNLKSLFC